MRSLPISSITSMKLDGSCDRARFVAVDALSGCGDGAGCAAAFQAMNVTASRVVFLTEILLSFRIGAIPSTHNTVARTAQVNDLSSRTAVAGINSDTAEISRSILRLGEKSFDTEIPDQPVEIVGADSQKPCGFHIVATGLLESGQNELRFGLTQSFVIST